MHRRTALTAVASTGVAAAAVLALAAPALAGADVVRAVGDVFRYTHAAAPVPPQATVPEGATARVHSVATPDGRTIVTLHVKGFAPSTEYGAHAHVNRCGDPTKDPAGMAAGGHYAHVPANAEMPPTHPAIANPQNEVWLDLTTNAAGTGHAKAVVDWQFRPQPTGRSVIIHERHTSTADGSHGVAGKRVACLDVDF
jgi:Cu-Zn family superoxide dismutase